MHSPNIEKLTFLAHQYMSRSTDPMHDVRHVRRVVRNAKRLSKDLDLTEKEQDIVALASWWHDVGRTITNKPSFILLSLFDDIISALMLWRESIKCGVFGDIAGITIRIILCKNIGAGHFFTKLLLKKKNRVLLDIVEDADNLDVIHPERIKAACALSQDSLIYKYSYKIIINWYLKSKDLHMRTKAARVYAEQLIKRLIEWFRQSCVLFWHIERYGKKWVYKNLNNFENLLTKIQSLNLTPA